MIVTDDDDLAERLRLLRSHGMTTLTWDRHRGHAHSYDVVTHGFNYRLDEIRAALGLVQLRRLPEGERAARRDLGALPRGARRHGRDRDAVPGSRGAARLSSHHLAVVLLPEGVDRVAVRDARSRSGASRRASTTRRSTSSPPTTELGGRRPLPRTDAVADRVLTLPLYAALSDEQVETVVRELVERGRGRLGSLPTGAAAPAPAGTPP